MVSMLAAQTAALLHDEQSAPRAIEHLLGVQPKATDVRLTRLLLPLLAT